jgi:hypothetical protein
VLTGNDLGKLGNVEKLPSNQEINDLVESDPHLGELVRTGENGKIHAKAKEFLDNNKPAEAWKILLAKKN